MNLSFQRHNKEVTMKTVFGDNHGLSISQEKQTQEHVSAHIGYEGEIIFFLGKSDIPKHKRGKLDTISLKC